MEQIEVSPPPKLNEQGSVLFHLPDAAGELRPVRGLYLSNCDLPSPRGVSETAKKFRAAMKIKFPPQNEIFPGCDVVASPAGEELHLK
jgi:hypothetical protein